MMKVPDVVSTTACRSFGFSCCGSNKRRNSMNDIVDSFYLEMFRQHTCLTSLCFPNSGNASGQIPLPKGEGAAKRRVRGEETSLCTPHPALRATLSPRERDLPRNIFQNLDSTAWPGGAIAPSKQPQSSHPHKWANNSPRRRRGGCSVRQPPRPLHQWMLRDILRCRGHPSWPGGAIPPTSYYEPRKLSPQLRACYREAAMIEPSEVEAPLPLVV